MAQTRGKDGKFSGAGGSSMEAFVNMRENPGSMTKKEPGTNAMMRNTGDRSDRQGGSELGMIADTSRAMGKKNARMLNPDGSSKRKVKK